MKGENIVFTKKRIVLIIVIFFATIILAGTFFIRTKYKVTNVDVIGNSHYSDEEIKDMVMGDGIFGNSLFLSIKYKNSGVSNIPFIEDMSVEILSPDSIRIQVYEKALAGCVEYVGNYMYFDREGIVVETASDKTDNIPQVTGLQFGYMVLNEPLPVENENIFSEILNITQILNTYELNATKIHFDKGGNITLFFDKARFYLGTSDSINEKIMIVSNALPNLEGKSGILRLDNYQEGMSSFTFEIE